MSRTIVVGAAFALILPLAALAQPCSPGFQPGQPGQSGIFDSFSAYVQPMTEFQGKLVIGGAFSAAGRVSTNCIAAFDLTTNAWSALGAGANLGNTNGFGAALTAFPIDGVPRLIFGGSFASMRNAGGASVAGTTSIAAWNGSQWSSLATGWLPATGRSVWTLLDWQPTPGVHRLLAGGGYPSIGSATASGIAYFDGEAWNNVGGPTDTGIAGTFSPVVFASAVYGGNLYIAGRFASVNGVAAANIARWTGTEWQRPGVLGNGGAISDVSALYVYNDGTGEKLYAGGYDMRVGGQPTTVAAFNGTVWSRVGQNLGGRGTGLAAFDDGSGTKLYMGMTADAREDYFYRLENNLWVTADGGVSVSISSNFPSVFGLHVTGDTLYVGGDFQIAGDVAAYGIAAYRGCGQPPCPADFNRDGGVDGADVEAFFVPWQAGDSSADVNQDGGVDGADVETFFRAWEAGGC